MSLTEREEAWLLAANQMFEPRHYIDLRSKHIMLGPDKNSNYAWQDGWIYAWSESNGHYEPCWWLTETGLPTATGTRPGAEHVANLLRDRPFDQDWLKQVVPEP